MTYIVCTKCGNKYDIKSPNCPSCNCGTSETKRIEKIVLNIKNTRKGGRGFKDRKILSEICTATGMSNEISKLFLENMEHPYGKNYISQADIARNKQAIENYRSAVAENRTAHCPRCGSTQLAYDTKKLSVGRGIVGDMVAGTPGMIMGGLSSKKGYRVCLNCGKRWKL